VEIERVKDGGGMIRDTLLDEIPAVLGSGRLYATAAFVGAILYVLLIRSDVSEAVALWLPILVIFGIRMFAIVSGWRIPTVDLGDDHSKHSSHDASDT
jgi:uncharacterized membrane protein YeiH